MGTRGCLCPLTARPGTWGAPTHHGEGHTVDLVLVLRLVLPEGAVPVGARGEGTSAGAQPCPPVPSLAHALTPGAV